MQPKVFIKLIENIKESVLDYPIFTIISHFLSGIGFMYLANSIKSSNTISSVLPTTVEFIGIGFLISSVFLLGFGNLIPYFTKKIEKIWISNKEENSNLLVQFIADFKKIAYKFEHIQHHNQKSNENTSALYKESFEKTNVLYRESLEELLYKIELLRSDLRKNFEKESLQLPEYSDISPEDYKVIKVCFTEIYDLNKKIEKEQEEIDALKADTNELAYETQKVLSILQDKVGAK